MLSAPQHKYYFLSPYSRSARKSRSVDRDPRTLVDHTSGSAPLLRRFSLSGITSESVTEIHDGTDYPNVPAPFHFSGTRSKNVSHMRRSRKDVVYTAENMGFSHDYAPRRTALNITSKHSATSEIDKDRKQSRPRTRFVDNISDHDHSHRVKMRASSVPRTGNGAIASDKEPNSRRRAYSVARAYHTAVNRIRPPCFVDKYNISKVVPTKDNDGFDIAAFVLAPGEQFIPTNITVNALPSGRKAITYTRFSQKGTGDQQEANVEIDRIIQRTNRLQETMHTLEEFVKRNRNLFPEDIIIYQHIVFYLLDSDELNRLGENNTSSEVYGVKIRERLVAPFGSDVASVLKKYYSKHNIVEVEYMEREEIQRRLKEEMQKPEHENVPRALQLKEKELYMNIVHTKSDPITSDSDEKFGKHTMKESFPHFIQWLHPNSVRIGDCCRLTCSVTGEPEPTVIWYRNGIQVTNNKRLRIQNVFGLCSLEVSNIQSEDAGVYTARAFNTVGQVTSTAKLRVHDEKECPVINRHDAVTKPWFLIDPNNTVAVVGQRIIFTAQATGQPMPSVKWKKDSDELSTDGHFQVTTDELGFTKLEIQDVQLTDAGVYVCLAENITGQVKCAATLRVNVSGDSYIDVLGNERTYNVNEINQSMQKFLFDSESTQGQGPHFIQRPPVQMNVFEGEPLTLRCIVEGSPRPIVTWYKGVRELTYSKRHRVMTELGNGYMMQIKSVLQTDPGEYTAVATNGVGQAHITMIVNVLPKHGEENEISCTDLKRDEKELHMSRRMEQQYMPPIFIVKLPREKTITVGATLFFNCLVEKAKLQEYLVGLDTYPKKLVETLRSEHTSA